MKVHIVAHRNIWFIFGGAIVLVSLLAILIFGLKFGIDFTGGSLLEVHVGTPTTTENVRSKMEAAGYPNLAIQSTSEMGFIVRTGHLSEEEHQALLATLETAVGSIEEVRFDSIGPVIGEELRQTALMGVVITLLLIGLYVAWAYRKVSESVASWTYAVLTILTAFHDVLVTVGVFAILGHFYGWEIGSAFIAAILTILGYSINDTVVVFDRTRENLLKGVRDRFEDTVELSIQQTLTRSLNTSITTLLALLSIFLLGGESTKPFALALMIGIVVGTYSSIFLASPALVVWELRKLER